MTITTRAELITQIGSYLQDDTLSTQSGVFIQLAEAMFNRRIFVSDNMETVTSSAAASISMPADFNGIYSVYLDDYGPLAKLGADDFQTRFAEDTATGVPEVFMSVGSTVYLGPPPDSAYTVTMHYWAKLAALTETNPSNWLLLSHPDLYLYASLLQAEMYGWNDARLPLFKEAVEITTAEIMRADYRVRRTDLVGSVSADFF